MLSKFNKIVIVITSIVLIISLLVYGLFMSAAQKNNYKFPPNISKCPDYWDISMDSTQTECIKFDDINNISLTFNNVNNSLNNKVEVQDDSIKYQSKYLTNDIDNPYTINENVCEIMEWSKKYNISWSGLTNDNNLDKECKKLYF